MKIFAGNANRELAEKIAQKIGSRLGEVDIKRFPDGEIMVRYKENIRGRDVFIMQPTCPPPNENLMELLIMIDAARRASAKRITAVMPYFGYARQDRKDRPRVPITAKLVANLLSAAGVNRVLTMDLHAQQIQGFFDIPVDHLYALPVIVTHVRALQVENPVVVSPDPGGLKMAYQYSRALGAGLAIVAKQRVSPREVETYYLVGDVKGRTAIMVDDLTTTAGTLCAAAELMESHGAKEIYGAVSHCLIDEEAARRLQRSPIKSLITTDSVPQKDWGGGLSLTVLSVADLMGEAINRIHTNQSVTSLFRVSGEDLRI
ncbi:MAG TPA: ribose-phosphate pyrophosphokinase [Kiritimatiellae bacterium]|nr:ribose-phosphate pyrophosphokinase [Kiritimatiellia bacterium]